MPSSCYYNKKMFGASWFLPVSLFAERSYRSCGEKFITLPVKKPMQNGIEGCFPPRIIPHTLRGCALSSQASSRRFLFRAEHDNCGRAKFGMASQHGVQDAGRC